MTRDETRTRNTMLGVCSVAAVLAAGFAFIGLTRDRPAEAPTTRTVAVRTITITRNPYADWRVRRAFEVPGLDLLDEDRP